MKKFIRWLCRESGVEDDIRTEMTKELGGRMRQDAYWFSGKMHNVGNALFLYSKYLRDGLYADIDAIRTEVFKRGDDIKNRLEG